MPTKATKKKRRAKAKAKGSPVAYQTRPNKSEKRKAGQDRRRKNIEQALGKSGVSSSRVTAARREGHERLVAKVNELEALLNAVPIPVWISRTADCRVITGNRAAAELFDLPQDTNVSQTPAEQLMHVPRIMCRRAGRDLAPDELPMQRAAASGRTVDDEIDIVLPDGRARTLHGRAVPLTDLNGAVTGVVAAFSDATKGKQAEERLRQAQEELECRVRLRTAQLAELNVLLGDQLVQRKQVEVSLRESNERFRTFLDHAPSLAFMKASDGRYLYVNRRFEEVFHLDRESILGKTDMELFPREQARQYQTNDRLALEAGTALEFEETALYIDGLHRTIAVKFPVRDGFGQVYATGGIVTDITDRKQAEDALHQSREELRQHRAQLQDMAAKLFTAQEAERRRIARDLHDDFSQRLAALVLHIASLEQQPPLLPELIAKALEPVREQLEQLSDDTHKLAYALHPSLLEHAGLQPAIEDHIHKVTQRTGIRIDLQANDVPVAIPLEWATCLFRVLQESLQNIVKHANATGVMVKLSRSSKGIGVSVTDNGKGFNADDKSAHQKGLGLISMQERLRQLDGFFRIHSSVDHGTKVCAWIPDGRRTP